MAKIPESAYATERSANKEYDKERKELRKLNPGKNGWLGSGKQSDNIKADERKTKEKSKSDAALKSIGVRSESPSKFVKSKTAKKKSIKKITTKR